jgi:hypothetical protein
VSFSHPTLHVIHADNQYVMWSEVFAENAWLGDSAIFVRGGRRYQVVRQQHGGHHYYVWARRLED